MRRRGSPPRTDSHSAYAHACMSRCRSGRMSALLLLHVEHLLIDPVQRCPRARLDVVLGNHRRARRRRRGFDRLDPCVEHGAGGDYEDRRDAVSADGRSVRKPCPYRAAGRHGKEAKRSLEGKCKVCGRGGEGSADGRATYVVRMSLKIQTPSSVCTADRAACVVPHATTNTTAVRRVTGDM